MKSFKLLIVFFIACGTQVHSQILEELKAPTMPAATMIGTQINEISRPKTLKALETSLFNNFLDSKNNILIPNNYGLEFNPYMIGKRTNFDYSEFIAPSAGRNMWRNLSFSLASTTGFKVNDSVSTNALGFGGRTVILNGKISEKLKAEYELYLESIKASQVFGTIVNGRVEMYLEKVIVLDELEPLPSGSHFSLDTLKQFLLKTPSLNTAHNASLIHSLFKQMPDTTDKDNFKDVLTTVQDESMLLKLDKFTATLDAVKTERYGLKWEIDAALALSFPTNDFDYSIIPRGGFWTNVSYRPAKKEDYQGKEIKVPSNFEFIGLARFMKYNDDFINRYQPIDSLQFETGSVFDFGIRGVYEYKKFSVELEYIYRLNQNKESVFVNDLEYTRTINDDTYKFVVNINYNITDDIVLSYTIGKNYSMISSAGGNLISGFSLNVGFGGVKKEDVRVN